MPWDSVFCRHLTCPLFLWVLAGGDRSDERPFFGGMAAKRLVEGLLSSK